MTDDSHVHITVIIHFSGINLCFWHGGAVVTKMVKCHNWWHFCGNMDMRVISYQDYSSLVMTGEYFDHIPFLSHFSDPNLCFWHGGAVVISVMKWDDWWHSCGNMDMRVTRYQDYGSMMMTDDSHVHVTVIVHFSGLNLCFWHGGAVVTTLMKLDDWWHYCRNMDMRVISYQDHSSMMMTEEYFVHIPVLSHFSDLNLGF